MNTLEIQLLDDVTINKIAAGEVIERPASALKELLENSSDSGASRIEVSFEEGGKSLIKVVDNGYGIKPDELKLAITRHATSKIKSIDDLFKLQTLGFRGEALASLGAVSRLTLSSCLKGANKGAQIFVDGGKLNHEVPAAANEGTQVEVKDLFYNVPARRKFLKSTSGETFAIKKVFKNFAIAHPQIHLVLKQDQKVILNYPPQDFFTRCCQVLEVKKQDAYYVNVSQEQMQLEAMLVHPNLNLPTQQGIYIFVQSRPVQDKLIQQAIYEGYRNLVMEHQYPQAVINLKLDPALVDVNTHPAKLQVKFQSPSLIFKFIQQNIKAGFEKELKQQVNPVKLFEENKTQKHIEQTNFPTEAITQYNQKSFNSQQSFLSLNELENIRTQTEPISETQIKTWSSLQVIGQFANTYIVAQSQKGLVLIDQHAAHERVLFERLKSKSKIETQANLIEELIELSPDKIESLLHEGVQKELENLGFNYHQRGPETLLLDSKPSFLSDVGMQPLFERLAGEVLEASSHAVVEDLINNIWASMSCHGAIRAGKVLSNQEMQSLLVQMEESSFSSFCPHGRPVSVLLSKYDLEKLFKRIV
ncbi:MAG: DNA mismatch repair endonuclease MutL [Oligoflexia bacterium]|nr:DNA mismatch repair endonuclease MutL [Oligoflexia bacterium]